MRKYVFAMIIALILILGACSNSSNKTDGAADDYPSKQIRYIVPYGPGGLSDVTARVLERVVRENDLLDEAFTVTNIDGASAGNGMTEVRDAKADGHTLLHHHTSFIAHELSGVRDWGFEEFTPVASLFEVPGVILTTTGKYDTLEEWIEDVKNNKGETTFAGSSIGGSTHLFAAQILEEIGISDDLNYVGYGSGGDVTTAMLGGEDNVAAAPLPQNLSQHQSGELKILAVGSDERLDILPDVPTFKELGIDVAMPVTQRMGVWAPPETSDELVEKIHDIFKEVIESEDFIEEANELGISPNFGDGELLYELFENDKEVLGQLIEDLEFQND